MHFDNFILAKFDAFLFEMTSTLQLTKVPIFGHRKYFFEVRKGTLSK